ncbi:NAD-dependent protein deacylase, partial [Erwinia amylovora]|uniref:Sir2 family NAD-dependent protein deacetylase n=1 Tax=Erwinia amylovora TaxID=552 RepID=UPI002962480C
NQSRRQLQMPQVQPNAEHMELAELEAALGVHFLMVTHNIDNLHERAGNHNIIHLPGEILKVRCTNSGQTLRWKEYVNHADRCECC